MKTHFTRLKILSVTLLSLGFLSGGMEPAAFRKIACLDGGEAQLLANSYFPIENDLFGRVRSEAEETELKANAMKYYNFLNRVEMNYYMGAQAAQDTFGIKSPLFTYFGPFGNNQGFTGTNPSFQFASLSGPRFSTPTSPSLMASPAPLNLMGYSFRPNLASATPTMNGMKIQSLPSLF